VTRFIAILIVFAILWMVLKSSKKAFLSSPTGRQIAAVLRAFQSVSQAAAAPPQQQKPSAGRQEPGRLVSCSVCGTHVLQERCQKIVPGPKPLYYCSEACLLAAPKRA